MCKVYINILQWDIIILVADVIKQTDNTLSGVLISLFRWLKPAVSGLKPAVSVLKPAVSGSDSCT